MADEATYGPQDFALPVEGAEECDLVLKGGVTSGVVYPYAILEVAKKHRLRSIGGASAGAIAAGFAAAAEFARRNGDPAGFVRLGERCETLPDILLGLFQPAPKLRPLFRLALAFTAKSWKGPKVVWAMRGMLLTGAGLGAAAYALALWAAELLGARGVWTAAALPGLAFALFLGAAGYAGSALAGLVLKDVPANRFGLCSGLRQRGHKGVALTEWLYGAIQHIAFGGAGTRPLTFGDLEGPAGGPHGIDFRAMTTNLSQQRPEVIPRTKEDFFFDAEEWRALFPTAVMDHLLAVSPAHPREPRLRRLPEGKDLPILVGIRMSLSFPVLIQAIPLHVDDRGALVRGELPAGSKAPIAPVWFSDGGITSNFPIHFFDTLLPQRPTFAFSLDELPQAQANGERISMPQDADEGVFLPIHEVVGLGGFASSILASAKDWQDQMQSVLPGQRQRVVRIRLLKSEGGLNLDMTPEVSRSLMAHGRDAGRAVREEFDFQEHKWRRALVAYEQLEVLAGNLRKVWPDYGRWYRANVQNFRAYKDRFSLTRKREIAKRMDGLAQGAAAMEPPMRAKFPRPTGRLRTTPEL